MDKNKATAIIEVKRKPETVQRTMTGELQIFTHL